MASFFPGHGVHLGIIHDKILVVTQGKLISPVRTQSGAGDSLKQFK